MFINIFGHFRNSERGLRACIPVSDVEYPRRRDRPQATAPHELSATTARSIPRFSSDDGSFYTRACPRVRLDVLRANETYCGAGDNRASFGRVRRAT